MLPRTIPIYDPSATPSTWRERMSPTEFAVHTSNASTCTIFPTLSAAETFSGWPTHNLGAPFMTASSSWVGFKPNPTLTPSTNTLEGPRLVAHGFSLRSRVPQARASGPHLAAAGRRAAVGEAT